MRTVEIIQIIATITAAALSFFMAFEQRLIKTLKKKGALSETTAIPLPGLSKISRRRLNLLLRYKAVLKTTEEKFYLDEAAHRSLSKKRVSIAIPATLAVLILVFLFYIIST